MGKAKTTKKNKGKKTPNLDFMPDRRGIESIMANMFGDSSTGSVETAQRIMYDAWETSNAQRRVSLAKKALKISPDCADAYVLLAEDTADSPDQAMELYRQGVEAGERALGKQAFKDDVGYFWGLLETRPYMRARQGLAQCLWEIGQQAQAVEHYWDMLRLNPNDNQGIRDLLMACLLELGRDADAEKLYQQYKEDCSAVWMYSRVLLDFRKSDRPAQAGKSLKKAIKTNPHIPAYLLGRQQMPRDLPEYYSFGDESEAVIYVYGHIAAWETTPEALKWLAAQDT